MADHGTVIIKKKKVHGGHGHHGGSWKVAYADFVTAMMAFFMVMWIMGLSDQSKAQISGYFNDPMGFMKSAPSSTKLFSVKTAPSAGKNGKGGKGKASPAERKKQVGQELSKQIQKKMLSIPDLKMLLQYMEFNVTKEGIRIELVESTGNVFFDSGSWTVRPAAQKLIRTIAPVLAATGREMIIEGHTDAKPYSGAGFTNWELSTNRASALRKELEFAGIPKIALQEFGGKRIPNLKTNRIRSASRTGASRCCCLGTT